MRVHEQGSRSLALLLRKVLDIPLHRRGRHILLELEVRSEVAAEDLGSKKEVDELVSF